MCYNYNNGSFTKCNNYAFCYGYNKDKMMTYYSYLVSANDFIDLTQKNGVTKQRTLFYNISH